MGKSNNEEWIQPNNGLNISGLLPNEEVSVTRMLDPERWRKAEQRTEELIACIQPNRSSEEHRKAVASYVQCLIMECIPCQVCTFGSVPLKTYLPDGDIDLTALSRNQSLSDNWATKVRDMLEREEKNDGAEFRVREVQYVQAEVKLVKCLVDNIVVDISFNQLSGLCTLCFLEEVDHLIGQNHLFKRSIILIKAWCYYESRLLGAYHGLISTYALETLVLYIFHVFNNSFAGPLEVLYRFLEFFSKFDWDNFCISLWGPAPIRSLHNATADPPRSDGGELLLSKSFLDACSFFYSVYPRSHENFEQPFISKFFNVIDPLRTNNNLGRSVNKGNFYRIRSAFAFGAQRLARLVDCPKEDILDELDQFFLSTWDRNGKGYQPDTHICGGPHVKKENSGQIDKKTNGKKMSSLLYEEDHENARRINVNAKSLNENGRASRFDGLQNKVPTHHQFPRTYSSPELTNTSNEVLYRGRCNPERERLQEKYTSNSNFSWITCGSRVGDDSNRKSGTVDPSLRRNSLHWSYDGGGGGGCGGGGDIHVKSSCGSENQISNFSEGEELASMGGPLSVQVSTNTVPYGAPSLGGPVQLPASMFPSMFGYAYQNPFGMTLQFPSLMDRWSYSHELPSMPFSRSSTAKGMRAEPDEVDKHHDDDEQCFWDYDVRPSREHNSKNKCFHREETIGEKPLSAFSGQGSSSGHESIRQPVYRTQDGKVEENGETVGGSYNDGTGFRNKKALLSGKIMSLRDETEGETISSIDLTPEDSEETKLQHEGSIMVEHHSSEANDENNDGIQLPNIETPYPSVSISCVEAFQLSTHGLTHNRSNWVFPVGLVHQNLPGSWQMATSTSHPMSPISAYPAGSPVPFFAIVPVYSLPTETGNCGVPTHWLEREELSTSVFKVGQSSGTVRSIDKLGDSGESDLMKGNIVSDENSEEFASDILAGDFFSHWKNLEYGRHCLNLQLQFPLMCHPPMYSQGHFPNYDFSDVPSPVVGGHFAKSQIIPVSFHHHNHNQSRLGGRFRHHAEGFPMYRAGTGTYLPNQSNMGGRQPSSPRYYRANYNDEKREYHGDREKWNSNSNPRIAGRPRYQSVKKSRINRPMARNGKIERQWNGFKNAYCSRRHSYYGAITPNSVEQQRSESLVGSLAFSGDVDDDYLKYYDRKPALGGDPTCFLPSQSSSLVFGSVSDHVA